MEGEWEGGGGRGEVAGEWEGGGGRGVGGGEWEGGSYNAIHSGGSRGGFRRSEPPSALDSLARIARLIG